MYTRLICVLALDSLILKASWDPSIFRSIVYLALVCGYYVSKNKYKTNKCKQACWEINAMSKNCNLAPAAISYTRSEK